MSFHSIARRSNKTVGEIMKKRDMLVAILFSFGFQASLSNANNVNAAKLTVSISHVNIGSDYIVYSYNTSHTSESQSDAIDAQVILYLPSFLQFNEVKNNFQNVTADPVKNSSNIRLKVPVLAVGKSSSGEVKVKVDHNGLHGKWQHNVVVVAQLIWFDTKEDDSGRKQYHSPMIAHASVVTIPGCVEALGMQDGRIKDYQISAKTSDPALGPKQARPNSDAWCAKSNTMGQYIQIAFRRETVISRIAAWARKTKTTQWVTKYTIQYSADSINWFAYRENGFEKLLTGASVSDLLYPFKANSIRIFPVAWQERICLRLELFGCEIGKQDNCIDPIGIGSGKVPDEAFEDSIIGSVNGLNIHPADARLNKEVSQFPFGWMARPDVEDWLQVDFGSVFKATSIAVQGSGYTEQPLFFVKTFRLSHSRNAVTWKKVVKNGREKIFQGPSTIAEAKDPFMVLFEKPIYGRYFRIIPLDFISSKVIRFEMYGCVAFNEEKTRKDIDQDLDLQLNRRSVLLDDVSGFFYACFRHSFKGDQEDSSCFRSKTGKTWEELNASIKRLVGYDEDENTIYAMDSHLSYLSRTLDSDWHYVTSSHWTNLSSGSSGRSLKNATAVPDILVTKQPTSQYTWTAKSGYDWGVSGDGIHRKENGTEQWQLVAIWVCSGN